MPLFLVLVSRLHRKLFFHNVWVRCFGKTPGTAHSWGANHKTSTIWKNQKFIHNKFEDCVILLFSVLLMPCIDVSIFSVEKWLIPDNYISCVFHCCSTILLGAYRLPFVIYFIIILFYFFLIYRQTDPCFGAYNNARIHANHCCNHFWEIPRHLSPFRCVPAL